MSTKKENKVEKQEDLLGNFEWDSEDQFFGIQQETADEIETILKEVDDEDDDDEKDEPGEKETNKKPADKKVETDDDEDDEDDEDESFSDKKDDEEEDPEGEEEFFTTLSKELKEKGVFQFVEIPEGEKITEEKFFELQAAEIEKGIEDAIDGLVDDIGDIGKDLFSYVKSGGKAEDFFKVYKTFAEVPQIDVESEEGQDEFITYYLSKYENLDSDDIKDRLEWLEESGKKKKFAQKYYDKVKEEESEQKKLLLENQEKSRKAIEQAKETFKGELKATLTSSTAIKGFPISADDKKELVDYITKPAVKIGANKYITNLQAEINKIFQGDKEKLLLLAKLIKSDFDTTGIEKVKTTEVVKKTKSNLMSKKLSKPSSSGGFRNRSLADYFNK